MTQFAEHSQMIMSLIYLINKIISFVFLPAKPTFKKITSQAYIQVSLMYIFQILLLFLISSCQKATPPRIIHPAFYHWQTQLKIDSTEASYIKQLDAKRLYVKFFDVDWDASQQQAIPKASLQLPANFFKETPNPLDDLDIVPTIFITNQTFKQLSKQATDELAARIWYKIQRLMPNATFKEIQLDCDWTLSTKEAYFTFLEQFKKQIPPVINLSVTIRLHQYKYPEKTGVPPAEKGMLMFYNMGDVNDPQETNSILNLEKAQLYLQAEEYPLPLDLALPIFHWGVLFREGQLVGLINGLDEKKLIDTSSFLIDTTANNQRYWLKKSTYLDGNYLYKGDEIRLENVSAQQLETAANLLKELINSDTLYLSFYHLNTPLLEKYGYEVFKNCTTILSTPME